MNDYELNYKKVHNTLHKTNSFNQYGLDVGQKIQNLILPIIEMSSAEPFYTPLYNKDDTSEDKLNKLTKLRSECWFLKPEELSSTKNISIPNQKFLFCKTDNSPLALLTSNTTSVPSLYEPQWFVYNNHSSKENGVDTTQIVVPCTSNGFYNEQTAAPGNHYYDINYNNPFQQLNSSGIEELWYLTNKIQVEPGIKYVFQYQTDVYYGQDPKVKCYIVLEQHFEDRNTNGYTQSYQQYFFEPIDVKFEDQAAVIQIPTYKEIEKDFNPIKSHLRPAAGIYDETPSDPIPYNTDNAKVLNKIADSIPHLYIIFAVTSPVAQGDDVNAVETKYNDLRLYKFFCYRSPYAFALSDTGMIASYTLLQAATAKAIGLSSSTALNIGDIADFLWDNPPTLSLDSNGDLNISLDNSKDINWKEINDFLSIRNKRLGIIPIRQSYQSHKKIKTPNQTKWRSREYFAWIRCINNNDSYIKDAKWPGAPIWETRYKDIFLQKKTQSSATSPIIYDEISMISHINLGMFLPTNLDSGNHVTLSCSKPLNPTFTMSTSTTHIERHKGANHPINADIYTIQVSDPSPLDDHFENRVGFNVDEYGHNQLFNISYVKYTEWLDAATSITQSTTSRAAVSLIRPSHVSSPSGHIKPLTTTKVNNKHKRVEYTNACLLDYNKDLLPFLAKLASSKWNTGKSTDGKVVIRFAWVILDCSKLNKKITDTSSISVYGDKYYERASSAITPIWSYKGYSMVDKEPLMHMSIPLVINKQVGQSPKHNPNDVSQCYFFSHKAGVLTKITEPTADSWVQNDEVLAKMLYINKNVEADQSFIKLDIN